MDTGLELRVKRFTELQLEELYQVLRLRMEVFVVEQNCAYQDIDQKDQSALHILAYYDKELIGYARCFPPGFYFEEAAIGRVIIKEKYRSKNLGHRLMDFAITAVEQEFNQQRIKISAQRHLTKFYEAHGFKTVGEGYLEDGIPHCAMLRI